MKKIRTIALVAASAASLSIGSEIAMAQNVSGGDPYQQGYAAGASSKERNSFDAFDSGYRAAEANQNNAVSTEAYNDGYQAGIAQANRDKQEAYNTGYQDRADWDRTVTTTRAYDDGFHAGAYRQARREAEYP
jgi:hypothetical protein